MTGLDARCSARISKNVAWNGISYARIGEEDQPTVDEIFTVGTLLKAFPQVVGVALTLELLLSGLQ